MDRKTPIIIIFIAYLLYFLVQVTIGTAIENKKLMSMDEDCIPIQKSPSLLERSIGKDFHKLRYDRCILLKKNESENYLMRYNTSADCLSAPKRMLCSYLIASKTNNASDCNSLDYCIYRLAYLQTDPDYCGEMPSEKSADYCYYRIAILIREEGICENIISEDCRRDCKRLLEDNKDTPKYWNLVDLSSSCNDLDTDIINHEVYI